MAEGFALVHAFSRERILLTRTASGPLFFPLCRNCTEFRGRERVTYLARSGPPVPGRLMVQNIISHVLSLAQAVASVDSETRVSRVRLDDPSLFNTPNVLRCHLEGRCIDLEVALYLEIYPEPPRPAWFEIDGARIDRTIGRDIHSHSAAMDGKSPLPIRFAGWCRPFGITAYAGRRKDRRWYRSGASSPPALLGDFELPALTVKPQIVCHYDVEEVGAPRQAVLEGLSTLFPELFGYDQCLTATERHIPRTANSTESLAHVVAKAILQTARPGQATTRPHEISIERRIAECIRQNIPIAAQILWSPKKHWITGPDSNIDLGELTALNTLLKVHANVRGIYPPGLAFTIDLEDIEFEFMEGADPDLVQSRYNYIDGLQKVIRIFGLDDVFRTNKMSDKAKDQQELRGWMAQMEENYHVLKDYWYESEMKGIDGFETYESFAVLKRLGWDGAIPREMRDHYLGRLSFVESRKRPR